VDELVADSRDYGAWYQYFNGIDITLNIRSAAGVTFVGGTSTGQTVADNCDVRAHLPELSTAATGSSVFGGGLTGSAVTPPSPYCHVAFGVLTQLRGLATYVIPWAGVQLAATIQSKPGPMLTANYAASNAAVVSSLGRSLSGNASTATVNLVAPGTLYGDRIDELDIRAAKSLTRDRSRVVLALDVYNALNSSAALAYNSAFIAGRAWPQPITIVTPRMIKITAEFEF